MKIKKWRDKLKHLYFKFDICPPIVIVKYNLMKHIATLTLSILTITSLLSQNIKLNEVGQLSDILSEPSGVEVIYNPNSGQFEYWAHNDYDNPETIYRFQLDDPMTIKRELVIPQTYIDWEDMTSDENGNLYLGDFGNWVGEDELQIVKIPNPSLYNGNPQSIELIPFVFEDLQKGIVEDIEAMFHLNESIYFFTKSVDVDSADPSRTYCFKMSDSPNPNGQPRVAELISSFQVVLPGDPDPAMFKVTAADISPDQKTMVLQSYSRLWVFSCFEGDDFFNKNIFNLPIDFRQYEGIVFVNNHEVVITKEGNVDNPNFNPKVFHIDLHPWINGNCLDCKKTINGAFDDPELGWSLFEHGEGEATLDMSNDMAEIDISNISTSLWHINLRHKNIMLEQGHTYRITYSAHAESDRPISVIVNKADGSVGYFYTAQDITSIPTTYTHEFVMEEETDFNSFFSLNVGRGVAHKVFFDDVSLVDVECESQLVNVQMPFENRDVQIFPNPTPNRINILSENSRNYSYHLLNNRGELLDEGKLESGFIEVSQYQDGIYILIVFDQNKEIISSHKVVKMGH